jgi:polyisoprenoid-binding protein YceI
VRFDPEVAARCRVSLVIDASALKVSGAGEPPRDVPKVQETMDGSRVLDLTRFPRITFESTAASIRERQESALALAVTRRLTIRDVAQVVTVPVRLQLAGDALTATGQFSVNRTAFGITPISVGGVVAVKDALEISFSIRRAAVRA